MDTPIERKSGITRKHLYIIGGITFAIAVILYFILSRLSRMWDDFNAVFGIQLDFCR